MRITLMCAYGMSTDLLVREIKKYSKEDDVVAAYSVQQYEKIVPESDVILMGPQARAYLKTVKGAADPLNIPVGIIDVVAYGRHNGEEIYQQALKMYNEVHSEN